MLETPHQGFILENMMKKTSLSTRIVLSALLVLSMLAAVEPYEYLWLHVEGRYIKTSSYANPPNEIFVAVGTAYDQTYSIDGNHDAVATWLKAHYGNAVRVDHYPYTDNNFNNIVNRINNIIDPAVQACKNHELYAYIDCHEYFHEFQGSDGWFPTGPLWSDATFQDWADHWATIADYYKNEPWVIGYELCNEPYNVSAEKSLEVHLQCIQAIRQVDTRHIILLANNNLTHTVNMEEVWGPVNFRPDEPYNQVVFAFHEYTNADNTDITAPVIDYVQDRFNVPVHCTEFGDASVVSGVTEEMKRQFETDMFAMMDLRKIGWSVWALHGNNPEYYCNYDDIWQPAAESQGSSIPQASGEIPQASKIICGAYPEYVYNDGRRFRYVIVDGNSIATVKATICDDYGCRVSTATNLVSFSVSGEGMWEDGTTGVKSVNARDGIATINLKATSTPGTITVNAGAGGLTPGSVEVITFGTQTKLSCSAEPDTLPANGESLSLISARIEDNWGNVVPIAQNAVTFSLEGSGSLWITEAIHGNKGVMENGTVYILLKSGTADEIIKVTASADGLISDFVNVYVGDVEKPSENPFDNVKVYPNPFKLGDGSDKAVFTSLPGESVLRIYTLSGKLVRTLSEGGTGKILWDGRNSDDKDVSKGIYIYLLTEQQGTTIYRGHKKTGALVIVR